MNIWINLLTPKNLNICMKTWKYIQKFDETAPWLVGGI